MHRMKNTKPNKFVRFLQKLKPFFDFRIENIEDVISILLGVSVFGIIVFRAYFVDITYDEAYTYLNTGRIQDVWRIYLFRIANTHVLNSLLMTLTTLFVPYTDFAIRFPSVFISGLYVATAISFSKKFQNRLMVLGLLLSFYYFIEFMALARGYGMSATFILAAFFVYKEKSKFTSYYLWIVYLFLLAIYASYVAIVPFGIMVAYMFVVDFKFKIPPVSVKNKWWIIGLGTVALYGFYSVTKVGKPLYGAYTQTFFEAVPQDILMRFLAHDFSLQIATIGSLVLAVLIIASYFITGRKNPVGIITVTTFLAIFLVAWVGEKPLPTGRVLIPYWPLFVLSFIEVVETITKKTHLPILVIRGMNITALAFLIFNFQSQLEFEKYVDSKANQWKTPINIMSGYGKDIFPHDTYYLEKDWKHDIVQIKLKSFEPDEVIENSEVTFKVYDELGLITIDFKKPTKGVKLFREVTDKGEVTYSDTISLDAEIYNFEDNRPMLLSYPRFGGEMLKIGNLDGSWKHEFKIPVGMADFFPPEKQHSI